MPVKVRACRDADEAMGAMRAIAEYGAWAFGPEEVERWLTYHPLDRMIAAFDGRKIVGGSGSFPFEMTAPGAALATAGITVVGVLPTHRRRGVLTAMMRHQLDDVHGRGEPLAALFASDERIYGRYGYGLAHLMGAMSLARERSGFAQPLERRGSLRYLEPDEALHVFPPVWDAARRETPGMFSRSRPWWQHRVLRDPEDRRPPGSGPKRFVAWELDGRAGGYAIYRHAPKWEEGQSTGTLNVPEVIARSAQATAELWRYLFDIEWVAAIQAWLLPLDHPLFLLLAEPRQMRLRVGDGLFVRLVDVGAALSERSYAADGSVVFEVADAFCPWNEGRWKLEDGTAKRSKASAHIACDVTALGSVFLGGFTFAQLARAGRIEELRKGAVAQTDAMFRSDRLPWCPEIF